MNIEELKLILSTVQAAGQGAFTLAIVWFVSEFIKFLIGAAIGVLAIVLIEKVLRRLICSVSFGGKVLNALGSDEELGYIPRSKENEYLNKIKNIK